MRKAKRDGGSWGGKGGGEFCSLFYITVRHLSILPLNDAFAVFKSGHMPKMHQRPVGLSADGGGDGDAGRG